MTEAQRRMLQEARRSKTFEITGRRLTAFDNLKKCGYIEQVGGIRSEGVSSNPRMVITGKITDAGRAVLVKAP